MRLLFKLLVRLIKWMMMTMVAMGMAAGIVGGYFLYQLNKELPQDLNDLHQPNYALPTVIFDRNGNQIEEIFIHRRIVIPFKNFPPYMIQALIASEDTRFFSHFGIDPIRILKALWVDIKAKRIVQGASTLTQQTARLFLLAKEKKGSLEDLKRKLKEILLALRIERQFSKEEILTLYLNKVFLGNAEGVEASTQGYFGKRTEELSLAESTLLVGLLPAPSLYSPIVNPDLAIKRRNLVLRRMLEEGFITEEERRSASREPIQLSKIYDNTSAATAYYVEHVRKQLLSKYGADTLYKGGLKVYLAMDLEYQIYAHEALQKGILDLSKRQGYRGPQERLKLNSQGELSLREIHRVTRKNQMILGKIVQGVVTNVSEPISTIRFGRDEGRLEWAHLVKWKVQQSAQSKRSVHIKKASQILKVGDVIQVKLEDWDPQAEQFRLTLHQEPQVNGAVLSIDPHSGEVLAMSGGYRFDESEFNRALQAKRQPGSVFKPVVYAAALDAGYTLASILVDSPIYKAESDESNQEAWTPKNYGNKLLGSVHMRTALVKSLNTPTIRLVEDLKPKRIIEYARKLGISTEIKNDLTIALGSFSVTLQEMVSAFGVFANEGSLAQPIYISKIEDRQGEIIEENLPEVKPVISKETAYLILDAMQDVVKRGTGRIARQIERPSAGKTGTTNDSRDAWYIGFIPQLLTGVYVGFDQPTSMGKGETGARAAAPIWVDFMNSVTGNLPTQRFARPPQIVSVKIHKSGRSVGPCDPGDETYYEQFKRGTEPRVDPSLKQQCGLQQETLVLEKKKKELDL
ncbi:MAG: PBP1A family penicillin-binding protein [SAR324 cluster bacterium]|nr:PBP1A family penicillin-binding protein [SAR324 cluster bacterium]